MNNIKYIPDTNITYDDFLELDNQLYKIKHEKSKLEKENKQLKEEKQNVINYIIKELYEINKHQYAKGSRRLKKILELLGDSNE